MIFDDNIRSYCLDMYPFAVVFFSFLFPSFSCLFQVVTLILILDASYLGAVTNHSVISMSQLLISTSTIRHLWAL